MPSSQHYTHIAIHQSSHQTNTTVNLRSENRLSIPSEDLLSQAKLFSPSILAPPFPPANLSSASLITSFSQRPTSSLTLLHSRRYLSKMEGDGANRDGGRTSNGTANTQSDFLVSGLQVPAPLRPDLIGAFDSTAHDSSLFDFSFNNMKTRAPLCQKTIWRVQQKINKIRQPVPVVAPPPIFLAPVPANWVPNPYKRVKTLAANGQERIADDADDVPEYEDTPNILESLEKSLFGAKGRSASC